MRVLHLQDRISRGLGAAARHVGAQHDAFRPRGAVNPLDPENRFLRLHAAFTAEDLTLKRPTVYGHATWSALFDSAYTRPGDYLVGPSGTFFIAAQQSLMPVLCVLTNRILTVSRPAAPTVAGVNSYGGLTAATATTILTAWPGSVVFAGAGEPGDLPGDASTPTWTILLPQLPLAIQPADVITDERSRTYTVGSTELTELGWRLLAKQAST